MNGAASGASSSKGTSSPADWGRHPRRRGRGDRHAPGEPGLRLQVLRLQVTGRPSRPWTASTGPAAPGPDREVHEATLTGGSVSGNKRAGLACDPFSVVEVARSPSAARGTGIDLAPGACRSTRDEERHGNMPYPRPWSTPRHGEGQGERGGLRPRRGLAVETGDRKGTRRTARGSPDGRGRRRGRREVHLPAEGRSPAAVHRVTFTATRQGRARPVTSEFSLDVDCSGVALVLVDRALDGGPGNTRPRNAALNERYRTLSDDGRFVAFLSKSTDLVEGTRTTPSTCSCATWRTARRSG